jgi:hypothetical protein
MSSPLRTRRLNILITVDEQRMVRELAGRKGVTPSDYVRLSIRADHLAVFGEQPTKPAGRKTKR